LGFNPEERLGAKGFELIHPDDMKFLTDSFNTLATDTNSPVIRGEMHLRHKDGSWRTLEAVGSNLVHDNVIEAVIINYRDITERKRADDLLKESEKKYRVILENASDAILLANEKGNLIEANRTAEEFFGYSKEELLQMNYTQLHPMIELDRTIAAFKSIVTHGCGFLRNGVILRRDSTVVPVDITATAIKYNDREVIQASFRDISEHKYTERALDKLVRERTVELSEKNKQLVEEIKQRKRAETSLKKQAKEIQLHSGKLQELNSTLKVLLKQRDEDRVDLEQKVMSNIKHLLFPHLDRLKKCKFDPKSRMHLDILESNLHNITSSFSHKLSSNHNNLTPTEIKVANLVKEGKTTKDIAEFLGSSPSSITIHRFHIRRKLGLIGKETNLQSYLASLS
jgi:PAS domain S-box-containing protein